MTGEGRVQVVRIGAYAICEDDAERVLLCRLAPIEADRGSWTLPGGGLEFGEDPPAAALRELEEETGLTGEILGLASVESRVWLGGVAGSHADDFQAIRILYRVRIVGGELRDEPDGSTDAAAWFSRAEIAALPVVDLVRTGLGILDGG